MKTLNEKEIRHAWKVLNKAIGQSNHFQKLKEIGEHRREQMHAIRQLQEIGTFLGCLK